MIKKITAGSLVWAWALSGTALAHLDPLMCAVVIPDQREEAVRRDGSTQGDAVCLPPLPAPRKAERPAWSEPLSPDEARASLVEADAALERGELGDALLHLRVVESGAPRIADRMALQRGELLLALGQPALACDAFALAADSPSRDVAVRGNVGKVRCLLEAGDRDGDTALQDLLRRYPLLSERAELQYLLARARAGWGSLYGAAQLLRSIDLSEPESAVAERARVELERLRALGVKPQPFTPEERVTRAERLLARGPIDTAEAELRGLASDPKIVGELAARTHLLIARLLRIQGRFDALRDALSRARAAGASGPDAMRLAVTGALQPRAAEAPAAQPPPALTPVPAATPERTLTPTGATTLAMPSLQLTAEELEAKFQYEKRVRGIRGGKQLGKLQTPQLRTLFDLALSRSDTALLDEVMGPLAARKGVMAGMRFDMAMRASGVASDASVLAMLETLLPIPAMYVPALYHHARTLERMGRVAEAEAELRRVIDRDKSETRYYAMWAQQRLSKLEPSQPIDRAVMLAAGDSEGAAPLAAAPAVAVTTIAVEEAPEAREMIREQAAARLRPLVERHGAAYPWLARALDLIELELFEAAADELSETYMAYRDAIGAPRLRAGLYAVYTDDAPPRRHADFPTRKARLALDASAQAVLRQVATDIGDPGIALRFGSWSPTARPRAYATIVEDAAKKYGVDPNLLFAVMRVESIYNRRIVSYAGAVGLMQIMPTTGRRIALQLGKSEYSVSDLLDPTTNVEMAAWYLKSLIDRFDGRLPLAIASYNGGPHNVRVWMSQHHPSVPLDAFLERIPFSQTHRYVRRVLTHYAAYRAQKDLPMRELSVELPPVKPDAMAF